MIRHFFERRNEENDEKNFSYVLLHNDVLRICNVGKQQFNYLARIARCKNTSNAKTLLLMTIES